MSVSTRSGRLTRSLPEADSYAGKPVNSVRVCGTAPNRSCRARTSAVKPMSADTGRSGLRAPALIYSPPRPGGPRLLIHVPAVPGQLINHMADDAASGLRGRSGVLAG